MNNQKLGNWTSFVLLSLIWGSSFILMKIGKEELTGIQIGALRIFFAGLVLLPFALLHVFQIPRNKLGWVVLSGLMGNFLPAFLFAIAIEKKIDSALAGILNSLTPLFVLVLGTLFFNMPLQRRQAAGTLVGFGGLLLLSLSKGGISWSNYGYASLILLATFLYGFNVHVVNRYLKQVNPLKMATVSLAFMSLPAAAIAYGQNTFSILLYDETARLSVAAAALLGIAGSAFATFLFYLLIKRAGPLFASLVTYAIPVVAIFWGLLAGEQVTLIQAGCLALILGGVYTANRQ